MESTERDHQPERDDGSSSAGSGSTLARRATSRMNSRVAFRPIGAIRTAGWRCVFSSQAAATLATSG